MIVHWAKYRGACKLVIRFIKVPGASIHFLKHILTFCSLAGSLYYKSTSLSRSGTHFKYV